MSTMTTMMSACGVVCSECPAYLAEMRGIMHQRRTAEAWRRIYGMEVAPQDINCGGCLGSDEDLFGTSGGCVARRCSRTKGFDGCAACADETCGDLERAQAVWDSVPQLAETLTPADFAEYARPYCGHRERVEEARVAGRRVSRRAH